LSQAAELRVIALGGFPEVQPGDEIAPLIAASLAEAGLSLEPGDILVVTHKIVSKAEGRLVSLSDIAPSPMAEDWAARFDKDPRQVEVALREARRVVRMDRGVLITETHHGFVCANSAVDASNVAPEMVCLLPFDPDASAAAIRSGLMARFDLAEPFAPGVIVSDSFGRPWRNGIVNVAIGVAGLAPLADYRGQRDASGYELHVSVLAVADELASAAELLMNKLDGRPVVLIRGYQPPVQSSHGTGEELIMDPSRDLFR
jgi:coenzyme F420-0:L-glutamate ligase/coenzyme F420-1:gamma-L-glutamate ligase